MIQADPVARPGPVAVPSGDPAELRAAASTLSASAEALESAALTAEGAVGAAVPSAWSGGAARSCGSAQERAVADCRALVRAMREAAAAVAQLAAELDEAIREASQAADQATEVAAALLRVDRMSVDVLAAEHAALAAGRDPGPSELPGLQARARQLAADSTHLHLQGAAAAERARLANLAAAAAFDQVTATLPNMGGLGAECTPATRTQLAALLGRPMPVAIPAHQDADAMLGLAALLAGGVVIDFAKKGKGKRGGGGRATPGAAASGGPSSGKPPERGQQQRATEGPVWTRDEAEQKALAMGFVKTNLFSRKQPVYRKGRRYISRDRDGHNGGAWKMASSPHNLQNKQLRMGTYNKDLTQMVGD